MRLLSKILAPSILATAVISCWSPFRSPEGFWKDYEADYQTEHSSDQGPWGGRRIVHWKNKEGKFDKTKVVEFATKHGWKLQSETIFKASLTDRWTEDNRPIFPLDWSGFTPESDFGYAGFKDYPRWISGDITVLSFSTNYISINLETQDEILTNGFVILNNERNQMTMYHMWGE